MSRRVPRSRRDQGNLYLPVETRPLHSNGLCVGCPGAVGEHAELFGRQVVDGTDLTVRDDYLLVSYRSSRSGRKCRELMALDVIEKV